MDQQTITFTQSLVARSEGFLSDATVDTLGSPDTVMASARYDLMAFNPALFDHLQIDLPQRLTQVVAKRQAEFLAGRSMARLAMRALSVKDQIVATGPDRAPIWPQGVAGSISHAKGLCLCLMSTNSTRSYGVDTEAIADKASLKAITSQTLSDEDQRILAAVDDMAFDVAATLAFSAKEALFKALYPRVGHHFGFDAAVLDAQPSHGQVPMRLTRTLSETASSGDVFALQYRLTDTHVVTWLTV